MKSLPTALLFAILVACTTAPAPPQRPVAAPAAQNEKPDTIAARTAKLSKIDGYIPLYWDAERGRLLMEISRFGEEMIYQTSLPAGVGSNPIGLDRSSLGQTHLVRFDRVGPRVLMTEINTKFRASSTDPAEQQSVADSFAQSVLAGFSVEAHDDRAVLVDATDFFLSDQYGAAQRLRQTNQGTYTVDKNRSAIYLPRTKAFPKNTEVEATLTFETHDRPGALIRGVAPVATAVTVREHHSFVELPPPGFTPRRMDPRVGFFGPHFYDYATPFTAPLAKTFIERHRLIKKNPNAAVSDPVEPIVYYVDNGTPEPIRSALIEGASWWSKAFEAAGFSNAFFVKVLPAGADPMDVRYNMINWIHRSTRGWSYGGSVSDPRTGEIIKGNVLLGSLRIRQDVLIGRGLIPQYAELGDEVLSQLDPKTSPSQLALARIRQLAAHETGHTLGLDHNFAASAYGRASVMDYPAPTVKIVDGRLDLSDAYATGVGPYDIAAIRYGYTEFPPGANEDAELDKLARAVPLFIKDADAREVYTAHPQASVWDNGADAVAGLKHEFDVRRIALSQFGLGNIAPGTPLSSLEDVLLPLYLHHRYQLEAAAKSIGGLDYTYSVKNRGDIEPQPVRKIVPAAQQRAAIAALVSTLDPAFLELPQRIIDLIPPRAYGYEDPAAELFEKKTAPAFDPVSAATTAADITVTALLEPHRCARLIEFHAEDAANPSMAEVDDALIRSVTASRSGYAGSITRAVRSLVATRLMDLASNTDADPQVRAQAAESLRKLSAALGGSLRGGEEIEIADRRATHDDIERFLARPDEPRKHIPEPEIPPGPPID